jgi:hypothetical protein
MAVAAALALVDAQESAVVFAPIELEDVALVESGPKGDHETWRFRRGQRSIGSILHPAPKILDLTVDEISIEDFMKRVHPDDAARFWANHEVALDPTNPKPKAHEYRIQGRHGEVRWVEGRGLREPEPRDGP